MAETVLLRHSTTYRYDRAVRLGTQLVRLRPRGDPRVPDTEFRMQVEPAPGNVHWSLDAAGNAVARLAFPHATERLEIEVVLTLDVSPRNPFDFLLDQAAAQWPFHYAAGEAAMLAPFLAVPPGLPAELAAMGGVAGDDTLGLVLGLAARVRARVAYVVRDEPGVWAPERTLSEGRGSCRDSAWMLVLLLRQHGIAARFVSGYLLQPPDGPGGWAAGDAELHAWAEAFLPGAGWVGIDATSGLLTAEGHVALAAAASPEDAAPVQGTVEQADAVLHTRTVLERVG